LNCWPHVGQSLHRKLRCGGRSMLDRVFFKERAAHCRRLAEKADPFIKPRLLELAARYDGHFSKRPSRAAASFLHLCMIRTHCEFAGTTERPTTKKVASWLPRTRAGRRYANTGLATCLIAMMVVRSGCCFIAILRRFIMLRIAVLFAVLVGPASFGTAYAQANKKNGQCSLQACVDSCNKKGGRTCSLYCSNEMSRRGCS
jgi:hypothetical protein